MGLSSVETLGGRVTVVRTTESPLDAQVAHSSVSSPLPPRHPTALCTPLLMHPSGGPVIPLNSPSVAIGCLLRPGEASGVLV